MCVRFSSNLYHSQQITDSGTHTLTCLSWLCCVPHNFCLIVCTLDVRMAERQSMSPFSTNAAFSETMWPCVCHLPYLMFLSSFFHSSVTMTAGWEGWDTERAAQPEKKKKKKGEFGEQISCLANPKDAWAGLWMQQPWAMHSEEAGRTMTHSFWNMYHT